MNKIFSAREKGIFMTDRTFCVTKNGISATDGTVSMTDRTNPVTDQTFSTTEKGTSATDRTISTAGKTFSAADKTDLVMENGICGNANAKIAVSMSRFETIVWKQNSLCLTLAFTCSDWIEKYLDTVLKWVYDSE
jgi:hypothetical protein